MEKWKGRYLFKLLSRFTGGNRCIFCVHFNISISSFLLVAADPFRLFLDPRRDRDGSLHFAFPITS